MYVRVGDGWDLWDWDMSLGVSRLMGLGKNVCVPVVREALVCLSPGNHLNWGLQPKQGSVA